MLLCDLLLSILPPEKNATAVSKEWTSNVVSGVGMLFLLIITSRTLRQSQSSSIGSRLCWCRLMHAAIVVAYNGSARWGCLSASSLHLCLHYLFQTTVVSQVGASFGKVALGTFHKNGYTHTHKKRKGTLTLSGRRCTERTLKMDLLHDKVYVLSCAFL